GGGMVVEEGGGLGGDGAGDVLGDEPAIGVVAATRRRADDEADLLVLEISVLREGRRDAGGEQCGDQIGGASGHGRSPGMNTTREVYHGRRKARTASVIASVLVTGSEQVSPTQTNAAGSAVAASF